MGDAWGQSWSVLRVSVRIGAEHNQIKIVWEHVARGPGDLVTQLGVSHVDREAVSDCATTIRSTLEELVVAALADPAKPQSGILKRLARAGADLHTALFTDDWGSGEACDAARRCLNAEPGVDLIHFVVDGSLHVPWGLTYGDDPELLPEEGECAWAGASSYRGFWCVGQHVSCVYSRIDTLQEAMLRTGDQHRVLAVVDGDALRATLGALPPVEVDDHRAFFARHGGTLETSAALEVAWRQAATLNRILFFFCHADGKNLQLGDGDVIDTTFLKLRLSTRHVAKGTASFAILNGCHTAVGQTDSTGFISATTRPGLFGFVGTEAPVPDTYALRFGSEMVSLFLDTGRTIVEVLGRLRAAHWPLSLVYGLYGDPLLAVRRDAEPTDWPPNAERNFSHGPFGDGSL